MITQCPLCGSQVHKIDHWIYACDHCHFRYYINPKPCTAAIITYQHQVLLVTRAKDPGKDLLDLPGGFVDPNENYEQGMIRELKEELNLDIKKSQLRYLGSYTDRYQYTGINYHTVSITYTIDLHQKPNPQSADDVASFEWYQKHNIPYDCIAFSSVAQALKDWANQ